MGKVTKRSDYIFPVLMWIMCLGTLLAYNSIINPLLTPKIGSICGGITGLLHGFTFSGNMRYADYRKSFWADQWPYFLLAPCLMVVGYIYLDFQYANHVIPNYYLILPFFPYLATIIAYTLRSNYRTQLALVVPKVLIPKHKELKF